MKRLWSFIGLGVVCFSPAFLRLIEQRLSQPFGLFSDVISGLCAFFFCWGCPRLPRAIILLLWAIFQAASHELFYALQRFPAWQDLHYLTDAHFVKNSTAGLRLFSPWFTAIQLASAVFCIFFPVNKLALKKCIAGLVFCAALFASHQQLADYFEETGQNARYNPLHWFIVDGFINNLLASGKNQAPVPLPPGLAHVDLSGTPILSNELKAKNLLIVVLEGIPGLYIPDIRHDMGINADDIGTMPQLAKEAAGAMLIPDFTVHSHQTIRGLYAMLCGDFSKQSWDTPKALELEDDSARAGECLPALMQKNGWSTHYLQGAGLGFMGKDRFMPLVGFQQVHGVEWFSEKNPYPFEWGVVDSVFFRGAKKYIDGLQKDKKPWMLTLLTVGTHQPYGVSDDIAARYPSRKEATVALLDDAVGKFLRELQQNGTLKNTLVIVTSDESHGSPIGEWASSWGLGIVLAPGTHPLPHIKKGGYGLVDMAVSVLDYFNLPVPPTLVGRSFFRDYTSPREMVSYTISTRRWHTGDNIRLECPDGGRCKFGTAPSLLGPPPSFKQDASGRGNKLLSIDATLDGKLLPQTQERTLHFASGEERVLAKRKGNDWSDNLIGAQYLDFPAHSKIEIHMRIKVLKAPSSGVQFTIRFKGWENDLVDIPIPKFPVVKKGEELVQSFSFPNEESRQSFSIYLLADGTGAVIKIEQFDVVTTSDTK